MAIAVIDYGMGNLSSVRNALRAVGADVRIVQHGHELGGASAIVLPGVGAFGAGMEGLRLRGFADALSREVIERKKPLLGICLGLSLLAEIGHEFGRHLGLGWVPGEVVSLDVASLGLRVPHVGWNEVHGSGTLFRGIPEDSSFYFAHSYHLALRERSWICATTEYGREIACAIEQENIMAVQFHPEKSHRCGLALLANFAALAA